MYILIDIKTNDKAVSMCLKPLCDLAGITTQTGRNWLKQPKIALKRGYVLEPIRQLKTKQGGNKPFFVR